MNVVFGAIVSGVLGGIVVVHAFGVPVLAYKAGMSLDQASWLAVFRLFRVT